MIYAFTAIVHVVLFVDYCICTVVICTIYSLFICASTAVWQR